MSVVECAIWLAGIVCFLAIAVELIFRDKKSKKQKDIEMWHERNKRNHYEDKC